MAYDFSKHYEEKDIDAIRIKLQPGMCLFEIIQAHKPKEEKNNYKVASDSYRNHLGIEEGAVEKYFMRDLLVRVHFWNNLALVSSLVKYRISEKVFRNIILLSKMIVDNGFNHGNYILIHKQTHFSIRYCFISEERYDIVMDLLKNNQYDKIKNLMYWFSNRNNQKIDMQKMKDFYRGGINED